MKILRMGGYVLLFLLSFLLFLYWMFPYDVVKERIETTIEQQIGGGVEVTIAEFEPYFFSGIEVHDVNVRSFSGSEEVPLLKIDRARARLAILPKLFGKTRVRFSITLGEGSIRGSAAQGAEFLDIDLDLSEVDLASVQLLASRLGLQIASRIDGTVELSIDRERPLRSTGKIDLVFDDLSLGASELKVAGAGIPIPAMVLAHGRESVLSSSLGKGALSFDTFKLSGGDLGLDVKGKIFLSNTVENYRLNLNGSFSASEKMNEALPFLFIVEKQRRPDGSYPITITGRAARPSIKVGTFTIPL